jgi:phosphate-selective porin
MRKLSIVFAAASIFTAASAAVATAQVTGIRHSDGSWTFVDANGRDIHKDADAGRAARHGGRRTRHDVAHAQSDRAGHEVTGYLPWLSR